MFICGDTYIMVMLISKKILLLLKNKNNEIIDDFYYTCSNKSGYSVIQLKRYPKSKEKRY